MLLGMKVVLKYIYADTLGTLSESDQLLTVGSNDPSIT